MRRQNLVPITMYVSQADYDKLKELAGKWNQSVSTFCRELIANHSPVDLQQKRKRGAPRGNTNATRLKDKRKEVAMMWAAISQRANKPDTPPVQPVTGQSSALDASGSVVSEEIGSKHEISSELRKHSRRRRQRA